MTGNIIDYLDWYGRFDFDALAFNEVDNLILAELSYATLSGIVKEPATDLFAVSESITIKEAAKLLKASGIMEKCCKLEQNAGELLMAMAKSNRFGKSLLSNYVEKHDFENQEQFSALHIKLPNGVLFVSFSGTDDTLLGWKEDFNMAYLMPVPSQTEATKYLEKTLKHTRGPVILGGHSKGGNLAIYSGATCSERNRKRIVKIYNNDGPGFLTSMVDNEGYIAIKDRITTIVPETSIIGMLLEHDDDYIVVQSQAKGILQHDGFNWQVHCDKFVRLDELSKDSVLIDNTVRNWIMSLEKEQRSVFVDSVYEVLTKSGIQNLSDFENHNINSIRAMIKEMIGLDSQSSKMVMRLIRMLISEYGKNVVKGMKNKKWK